MHSTDGKKEKINFSYNTKIYLEIAKRKWFLFVILFLVVTILGLTKLFERYLFKVLVDEGTSLSSGEIVSSVFLQIVSAIALAFIFSFTLRAIGNWLQIHFLNRLDSELIYSLKIKFFNHIIGLSHRFHATHRTGSLISRLTRGGRAMESLTDFLVLNGANLIVQLIIVSASIAYFDLLSGVVVLSTCIIFMSYSFFILFKQGKSRLEANNAEDMEKANIGDSFLNLDSIKYFGKESLAKKKFSELANTTKERFIRSWDFYRWMDSGQSIIISIGLFLMLYFPIKAFLSGDITLGSIIFIYTVYVNLSEPLYGFVWGVRRAYESMADFQALFEYNKISNEIIDLPDAENLSIKSGKIEFKDIEFAYNNRKIINKLSLNIKPGEKIAVVGHSGSGKTTLVKLLYRFYDVQSGDILIDGKSIKVFKQESLRSELSIVPQECILFDDTIYNNIAFSRPSATKREVLQAIKFAHLDKFILRLPQKEHTIVGERGVKLSGGEKQRVSIARAILANKKILVLDEATSSLDSQTEHEIQQDLEKLMKGRTSIIIAHRLSTIMSADRIIVMDKGKIAQIGTHSELIRKPGIYKQLWSLQKGGYIGE